MNHEEARGDSNCGLAFAYTEHRGACSPCGEHGPSPALQVIVVVSIISVTTLAAVASRFCLLNLASRLQSYSDAGYPGPNVMT